MRVLFATAEVASIVKVGGLADFSAGLTKELRFQGVEVEIVLPDYGLRGLEVEASYSLDTLGWASPAQVRKGVVADVEVSAISVPGMARSNPYVDSDGVVWPDNDQRFLGFSAATAEWIRRQRPHVVHLNDWHTAPTPAFLDDPPPVLLTIHNLAYQGNTDASWLEVFPLHRDLFSVRGEANPLAGGVALADRVITVSPRFAEESLPPNPGFGLSQVLAQKGSAFRGILNGIDDETWDPYTDPHLGHHFDASTPHVKAKLKNDLNRRFGWPEDGAPLIGMVTRLTDQKGVDIALEAFRNLGDPDARMVLLGSGDRDLAHAARKAESDLPERLRYWDGYDEGLAHRIFGASDLYLMPSRFEPAGLTQMQAMRYGSIPVVTDVGGLHDTVVDADRDPERGTGFVAPRVDVADVRDALERALAAWRASQRRLQILRRGMNIDWSWRRPAREYVEVYEELTSAR